jgi:hypothetical protein
MDSRHLRRYELDDWYDITPDDIDWILEMTPPRPGVFVFRQGYGQKFGRYRGESDILYVESMPSACPSMR